MPDSVWSPEVDELILAAGDRRRALRSEAEGSELRVPFPSPADWRDHWIYFLMVDRFARDDAPPNFSPWDGEHGVFQGGTFKGIESKLDYLKALGVGAIWLSPVEKNCQYSAFTYHGYGIQDFLRIEPRFTSGPAAAHATPEIADRELMDLIAAAHARGIYVILDIVLNHAGDVFEYEGHGSEAPGRNSPYAIRWRDETGAGRSEWQDAPASPHPDAAVWPTELRRNDLFRRRGMGGEEGGDFVSLKEIVTERQEGGRFSARRALIRAYQYLIAKFDIDGFRIDTLKYIEPDFALVFGNAMREFALAIGKKNFFTFGEVYDNEEKISHFIGRFAEHPSDLVGVDAALDFPLFFRLPGVAKGMAPPSEVVDVFEHRKQVQRGLISSHGEAGRFFVTFLDNHDQRNRFCFRDPGDSSRYDDQLTLAVGCLFTLQGIPCLYYGTEQGLHGLGGSDAAVREALWGQPSAFDEDQRFFPAISELSRVRAGTPALRYGRQYFRQISGNGRDFGISTFPNGVLAFSRILNESEVLVAANTSTTDVRSFDVVVDASLNDPGSRFEVLYSNKPDSTAPGPVVENGQVSIAEVGGGMSNGPVNAVRLSLQPMEFQVLGQGARRPS
jgi:glycosidase